MTEHRHPWVSRYVIVAAFAKDDREDIEVFRCRVGEYGALFDDSSLLSLHEYGWIPFAWRPDDVPKQDDEKWPPMWTDYLTEEE
jgi:hypothetical protein